MILHTIAKQLVRNWRTRVLSAAHSSSFTSALTQGRLLSADEVLASLRWQASKARATSRPSRDYGSCQMRLRLVISLLLLLMVGVSGVWGQTPPFEVTTAADETNHTEKFYWIESAGATGFYAVPHSNNQNASTTNAPTLRALWYFKESGESGYYYIINKTGKYLKKTGQAGDNNTIQVADYDADNDVKFKFSFGTPSGVAEGNWVIYPKDDSGNSKTGWLSKQSGNAVYYGNWLKSGIWNDTPVGDLNAQWKIVARNAVQWPRSGLPFVVSTSSEKHYYRINHAQSTNYNISYDGSNYGTISTELDNKTAWYFEEVATDPNIDNLKYYNIVNALSGKYLKFTATTIDGSNQSSVFTLSEYNVEDADRFQFVVVNSYGGNAGYSIMPKLAMSKYDVSNYANSMVPNSVGNNKKLDLKSDRNNSNAHWKFVTTEYPMSCSISSITYDSSTGKITITRSPSNAVIHYTLDGTTEPTSEVGTLYSGSFVVSSTVTIKAIATKEGYVDSDVKTKFFDQVATPSIQDNGSNAVSITSETEGATIYYTIDGSNPTTSSPVYSVPLTENISGVEIKAIAVKDGMINSAVRSGTVTLSCAKPVFTRSGNTLTITCAFPTSGVDIYYTKNGGDPTSSSTPYTSPISVEIGDVIKAIAIAPGYNSSVATKTIYNELTPTDGKYLINSQTDFEVFVDMASTTEGAALHYILKTNVNAGSPITEPFTGVFEVDADANGNIYTISGLTHALFNTINGGTVKNVMLDNVSISSGTNVGAICNEAIGASRIYNCGVLATSSIVTANDDGYTEITSCSSTISGSNYVGGLVGLLDGSSRVINCFSYANITGGDKVGGIVGWNNVATNANSEDADHYLKTMVMNCMFYGDITGGSSKAPIYNGEIITNDGDADGVNNFNYFWSGASYVQGRHIDVYNCALPAETRFLQRFEFFRPLLNSNRALAAWWATGDYNNKDEMMKWVMEPSQIGTDTPYPVLKAPYDSDNMIIKYPSVVNIDADNAEAFASDAATKKTQYNQGRKFGTLTITIQNGSGGPTGANVTTTSVTPNITDKDPAHFNFNYYKVQLPYYNDVGTKNYTDNKVVTGWKIVSISGGTNSFTTGSDATATVNADNITLTTPYNFADRKSTAKDLYSSTNKRVFSQGAYFDVPEGVTSITIEPYWAKCVYVSDEYPDVVYKDKDNKNTDAMNTASNVTTVGGGSRYTNNTAYTINGSNQIVYTKFGGNDGAVNALNPSGTVYDNAIVLVGNFHSLGLSSEASGKPFTIMSIDLDKDNEPDYSYILRFNDRKRVHPVRVDFLNVIGLGMAQKSSGGTGTYNFGIMQPYGWFECTNTALFRVTQFEYDKKDRVDSPMILQGGVIEQWVTVGGSEDTHQEGKTVSYYHVGGNVWFKEFHIGVHQDKNTYHAQNNPNPDQFVSPHPPISVTGGDFDEFYLTGLYNTPNNNSDDNAECYINGGRFGKVAGTGMQGLGGFTKDNEGVKTSYSNGNIIWQIDNADIDEFYAGGINAAHIAEGNIYTVITNSRVDQFCGGPKFGNMNSDKKVVTNAENCTFRTFFGAGYGGNSYNRRYPSNQNNKININWDSWLRGDAGYDYSYDSDYGGVETRIDYQFLPNSGNTSNVCRLFIDHISFSLATTHDVTSKLTDCTITTSSLGRLSISDDYKCLGSFYGGGSLGKVNGPVKSTLTNCTVEGNVFGGGYSATLPTVKVMNQAFQSEPYYDSNLGAYLEAELPATETYTWQHRDEVNSTGTAIDRTHKILYTTENLTTLGKVEGNVTLTINGNTTQTDGKVMSVAKSVYGGGEESNVAGNTQVNITGGTITQNVFGGGKGEADNFTCDKAMVGNSDEGQCADPGSDDNKNKGTIVSISNGTVNGNVYGGGEVGRVEWNTQVKIGIGTGDGTFAPEINGSVFGAGKGKETHGYAALVRGNSTVTIGGGAKVRKNVYGGGEQATVGRYWVKGIPTTTCTNETEPTYPDDTVLPNEMPYKTRRGGKSTVIVQGSAQIGPNDGATATAGHVYGAGKGVTPAYNNTQGDVNRSKRMVTYNSSKHTSGGAWNFIKNYSQDEIADATFTKYVWEYFTTETKYFEFLQSLALVTGTDVTINGATVKGNVYGGSESGFVQDDTDVKIQGGTIGTSAATTYGNVFGGGKGLSAFAEAGKVKGNTTVAINNGAVMGNVYGGGELGDVGTIIKPADYNYAWKKTDGSTPNTLHNNTITGTNTNTGICTVTISGGTIGVDNPSVESEHGNVFGAGKGEATTFWCEKAIAYGTVVSISAGTVKGNVYGGGQIGRVEDDTKVTIAGESEGTRADIKGSVFGAGAGLSTHGYSALVRGDTKVTVEGYAQVAKSVYGGGETASVGRYGLNVQKMPNILVGGGKCELKVQGNAAIGENVFGACKGVTPAYNNTQGDVNRSKRMVTYDPDRAVNPHVEGTVGSFWNFYENDHRFVWEYFTTQEAYSTYLETLALATHPEVTIDGSATVGKSVFGGGEMGLTKGSVIVTIQGGTIEEDVYGGGALSDTNTTELVADNYPTTAPTLNTDGSIKTKEVSPTTTVNLLGGLIKGDAYGGGLGRLASGNLGAVEAKVYGDVLVELNNNNNGNTADGTKAGCVVSRIFGANNKNGSPKGNITVHVFGTQHMGAATIGTKLKNANADLEKGTQTDEQYLTVLKGVLADMITKAGILHISVTTYQGIHDNPSSTADDLKTAIKDINDKINAKTADENTSADDIDALYARIYDVKAVYGGGNEAAYIPTTAYHPTSASTGSKTQVIIEGCDETSIETVYGGGNAASVPETNVDVRSAHEIQAVFGGGNGKDNTSYGANPGADVGTLDQGTTTYGTGNANTLLEGGYIHEAYGASNSKGKIMGNVSINTSPAGSCNLKYDKLVGAGKNADVDHDVIMVLGCNPTTKNPLIFGGADNANVNGNVELTITSGTFGQVFGGNNLGGIIKGHIKVNIEETECTPIRIDELYLGGNQAAYSSYGYYKEGEVYKPRTAAMAAITDPNAAGYHAAEEGNHSAPYAQPELNVISCTYIGKVFGGGYGERAILYGNPTVNINMIPGRWASSELGAADKLGEIVDVFGGGNQAKVEGNTKINIGTETKVEMNTAPTYLGAEGTAYQYNSTTKKYYNITVSGANITGNVYGGGNLADVTGNTQVNICAKEVTNNNTTTWQSVPFTASQVTIGVAGVNDDDHGNVYGGGKGVAAETGDRAFYCEEAMVGNEGTNNATNNNSSTFADYGTHVHIGNGTVNGSVYGGGKIGRVEFHTEVVVGIGGGTGGSTKSPVITGSVFGAGKGANTHGYSGLVRGDSRVTVQGDAKIGHSVYGGGEMASVGKYQIDSYGLPKTPLWGGKCTVTIQGYAEIGPDGMKMDNSATTGKPDDTGHVFGAGKGTLPYENVTGIPWSMELSGKEIYSEGKESAYYKFIQSLGLASNTEVTIGEHAFVKGSVYGGSENGYLQADAHVTIAGGQIGAGLGQTAPYADNVFIDPTTTPVTTENALATCATWTYDKATTGKPYDKYATYLNSTDNEYYYDDAFTKSSRGGAPVATDGHTYYGNVFGGGRGVVPFAAGKWHRAAGSVAGTTQVDITGGHILSSVYGGNENTDVGSYAMGTNGEPTTTLNSGGTCTINMSGGTVGVPRTKEQIDNNPVIGNVFGAGKGDKRVLFNTWTNVGATSVNISGTARIYGSVFGGGEDGHVIGNAVTNIGGTVTTGVGSNTTSHDYSKVVIGSTGISGADGNVFGGGRGSVTALTAGVVGGNVNLTINNGKILGSVYGGGRLASVGTNFVNPENTSLYGALQSPDADHGNITVYINDGTIGQSNSTGVNGNIFGGSKGTESDFRLGIVRSTTINMTGGTAYASVYGGGELAQVVESHTTGSKVLGTEINISGGTIGISGKGEAIWGNVYGGGKGNDTHLDAGLVKKNTSVKISETDATNKPTIIYHNIYGGGAYSSVGTITRDDNVDYVIGQASVTDMPTAWAANTGLAEVTILGGTIGVDGKENGMIFGSSRGDVGAPGAIHDKLAWVKDTKVVIGASGTDGPNIKGSVYGSGENGHTFHDTDVKVHSGTIGIASGADVVVTNKDNSTTTYAAYNYPYRGNVYGGGCGTDTYNVVENEKTYKKYNPLAGIVLGDATVTVDGGHVVHNVYGAGAMGSVGTIDNDEIVTHNSYTDDGKESYYNFGLSWPVKFVYKTDTDSELTGKTTVKIEGTAIIGVTNSDAKGGHIFGAARGGVDVGQTGIADQRYEEAKLANVRRTEVFIGTSSGESTTTTPTIRGSVYGGGEDGHVYEDANITIYHGIIAHSVFGGGKGESTYKTKLWSAANTEKDAAEAVHSWTAGKVYGNTHVTMNGGSVGYNIYGGGNLASVGKGNYSGGSDDYSADGYGEHPEDGNAGLWTNTANTDSYLFLNSGIAYVNIYGGNVGADSANDTEDGTATGFPRGNVFGSSRGVAAPSGSQSPRYRYKPDFFLGYVNKTIVTIGDETHTAPKIYGSVYGGGQDGHVRNSTLVTIHKGEIGRNGDTNIERGNVFGAGSGTGKYDSGTDGEADACNYSSGSVSCTTQIDIEGSTTDTKIYGNVYGGGALASVGPPFTGVQKINEIAYDEVKTVKTGNNKASVSYAKVNVKGGSISGSVYGASRGPSTELLNNVFTNTTNANDPHYYDNKKYATVIWSDVNVTGGANITGSVYGGGEKGIVKHATEVNIGLPAVGQTAAVPYTGTISEDVFGGGKEAIVGGNVTVNMNSGTVNKGVYGGGALAHTNTNNATLNTGDNKPDTGAKVTGDATTIAITGETNNPKTEVNLLGGLIKGDAYGGGLGRLEVKSGETVTTEGIAAMVYGDVFVKLGDDPVNPTTATAFTISTLTDNSDANKPVQVVNSGRVFGCNDLNGSPKGNVTVTVNKTVAGNKTRTTSAALYKKEGDDGYVPHTYEVAAVYGGGNLADYVAVGSGKKSNVIINSCDVSIEEVYGGGNAAAVPETDVLVMGAYEIENVFGGGNGEDNYTIDGGTTWKTNPGANVNGNATTLLKGGYIHAGYGGSNSRGTISGNVSIDRSSGGRCTLNVTEIYGAGKDADVEGDLILIMGCSETRTEAVYGCSMNANVKGNVELTITSGEYGKVFGGNNQSGAIFGHIIVNVEETGCSPIIIDELYGCGNDAAYSTYGYYQDGTLANGKPKYVARTSATDTHPYVYFGNNDETDHTKPPYADPEVNIISCTRIGKVFGGGLGSNAIVYGNPKVNINMIKGVWANQTYKEGTSDERAVPDELGKVGDGYIDATTSKTVEGGVFGGGNEAKVEGNTSVNIGTATSVSVFKLDANNKPIPTSETDDTPQTELKTVAGANITQNVYGGGNQADVTGNTFVNICAVESGTSYAAVAEGSEKVTIAGNVFGGGKGIDDSFFCAKAMVGEDGKGVNEDFSDNTNYLNGNTRVTIGNGTVGTLNDGKLVDGTGNVYGGGEIGRVEKNTTVTIGIGLGDNNKTSAPNIRGDVFGGGKGKKTHGYAALVRGNPIVTIQADAKVGHNVYGAGEIASVARYRVPKDEDEVSAAHAAGYPDAELGMPYALASTTTHRSGYCTVIVQGNAEIGPNGMKMVHPEITDGTDKPDDAGHVFAAGKGFLPEGGWGYDQNDKETMPRRMVLYDPKEFTESNKKFWEYVSDTDHDNVWEYFSSRDKYIKFIQTQALASNTDVTIDGNAFVKGSVYGGSENGLVQFDAKVYIKGGQIGAGDGVDVRYTDAQWLAENPAVLKECASWEYKAPYAPYDPYAKYKKDADGKYYYDAAYTKYAETGAIIATDGHTYYGNVFGGGSGSVPYFDADEGRSKYLNSAGTVKGNTTVEISGGHILTNVYGGCESTNVLGKATVKMTGGTLGVPRTDQQIKAHPVTCYLFGAGKGDQRVFFNKDTNVNDAEVEVDGGRIYGSVYGGGEDGHVMRHSKVTIKESASSKPTIIGTRGTSYYDGNVFGGGRGFGGDALTAGNVGGSVEVNIEGGQMLGSIYGGGRMASVGYGLYLTTEDGYGEMRSDTEWDNSQKPISTTQSAKDFFEDHPFAEQTFTSKGRGYITVKVSGGTIGNDVANAEYGGHVFGGSMGSITKQDGSVNSQWDKFATAKKTTVNVSGGTINRSVFGGGEMGTVTTDAIVAVSGGTIGSSGKGGAEFGNVYGGGKGYFDPAHPENATYAFAGIVKGNTNVTISETDATNKPTIIYHNIYGGGAYGSVGTITLDNATYVPGQSTAVANMPTAWARKTGNEGTNTGTATVTVTGGTIGTDGHNNGMVFGSSRGDVAAPTQVHDHMAWVYDTHVTIGTSGTETPLIRGAVYGSGENGHVFQNTIVDISGGTIGMLTIPDADKTDSEPLAGPDYPYRGNVYGGGCGTDKYYSGDIPTGHSAYDGEGDTYNALAGIVLGTTTVNITDGHVIHNVYGAGAMGSVGTMTTASNGDITINSGGTTTIAISGGKVGDDGTNDGNVFGAARGDKISTQTNAALVKTTDVTISSSAVIMGNVYGGGEAGDVGTYHTVTEEGNTKGDNNYLGDSGVCNVTMTGGAVHGHVFGAGKGEANTFTCQKAMVDMTNVNISAGTVGGNVYGGGEVGRVEHNAIVAIGVANQEEGTSAPVITGSVFGAGAGVETHGYSALARGNTTVTIQGNAQVGQSVYGGGMIASVGKYGLDNFQMPSILKGGGECTVTITDYAKVGTSGTTHHVFGAGRGVDPHWVYGTDNKANWSRRMMKYNSTLHKDGEGEKGTKWDPYDTSETTPTYVWEYFPTEAEYSTYLETLALATSPKVTIDKHASVYGDVYGGGERGITKGSVSVTINGGTIARDVYGGGALANTNIANWIQNESSHNWEWHDATKKSSEYTTTVNLHGGTIGRNVFGGGLGQKYKAAVAAQDAIPAQPEVPAIAALVYGDVMVKLNETPTVTNNVASFPDNCVVKGVIHGANNFNGSPQGDVTVHIYKTMARDEINKKSPDKDGSSYDLKAVYGGGNEAAYDPIEPNTRKAHVIIEGCGDTSIETVYGGGNAAAAPATHVEVNSCYEIGTVFAGGNGKDALGDGSENPGADVGLIALKTGGTPYANDPTKQAYGTGIALAEIHGGFVHSAFGGSNTKGNVRESATVDLSEPDVVTCPLGIDEAYGAGNEAAQDGTSNINLGCLSYLREIYGGAKNANVDNDIVLNIQSGRFHRVFGGNNIGGRIKGSITVNIEETGCHPIVIGQLFGGGNQAGYSVYGYKEVNGKWVPRESATDSGEGPTTPYRDPLVNVRSFTSIGEIYGGGFGNSAVIVGNPTVDINVCDGNSAAVDITGDWKDQEGNVVDANVKVSANTSQWIRIKVAEGEYNTVWQPEHKSGDIGTIGNVFGGGNAAPVHGNTNVYIGTKNSVVFETPKKKTVTTNGSTSEVDTTDEDRTHIVKGANITGNVYGGGNAADVTGDTNVVIGKEKN